MKQALVLSILTFLLCLSCTLEQGNTLKNEHIDKETKEHIRSLTDKLFEAITSNDLGVIQALLAPQVLETQSAEIEKLVDRMHAAFQAQSYRILDQYHILKASTKTINTISSGNSGENDYFIRYLPSHPETYVVLFIPNGLDSDFLITAIYARYNDQWKLDLLQFGQYGLFNRNALSYYDTAYEDFDNGLLTDALINMEMAGLCLQPAGEIFAYQKEEEIRKFDETVKNAFNAKYPFPLLLDNIETKPQIFNIHAGILSDGFHPMVSYLSSIPLEDRDSVEAENEKMKAEINRIFNGINIGKKYVFYRAYNELPDGEKEADHLGFVEVVVK